MKKISSDYRVLWVIIMVLVVVITIGGVLWWRDHNSSGLVRIKRKRADILQVAKGLYDKGEYKKAVNTFAQLTLLRDADPYIVSEARYKWGFCEYYLQDYRSARRVFKIYLNSYENKTLIHMVHFIMPDSLLQKHTLNKKTRIMSRRI